MASVGHHLVRRALDATQEHFSSSQGINPADEPQGQQDAEIKRLAMWSIALIWVTIILFTAMMSAVSTLPLPLPHPARLTFGLRSPTPMAMSLQLSQ